MRRTRIRKVGKIGEINRIARQKIAEYSELMQLTQCELKLTHQCMGEAQAPAHRHERVWYRSCPEKLWDPKQWVGACHNCHQVLDYYRTKEEKDQIFYALRGSE